MQASSVQAFRDVFKAEAVFHGFAPGRVNLIGEHTDYNGGYVLPCALNLGIECSAAPRKDRKLRFYSASFPDNGILEYSLDNLNNNGNWADYPISVIRALNSFGYTPESGADFAFVSNLPDGAGLSSSAALEVLTGLMLRELYGFSLTSQELAVIAQFAESRFIGVNCGIMDQFASAMGKKDNAVFLDTNTLGFEYVPVLNGDVSLVIINSGVKHSLASSAYNKRRSECETALAELNNKVKLSSLCELSAEDFETYKNAVSDPVCRKRAKHAVYENERTVKAAQALKRGDIESFGKLMNESHISLRDDYEVSCAEMDFLAEYAWNYKGVYGARMTGGGFGGCTVNLIKKDISDAFIRKINNEYNKKFGKEAKAYKVEITDGARSEKNDL